MDVGHGIFSDNLHVVGQSIIMHTMPVCMDCLAHLIAFDMLHAPWISSSEHVSS